MGWFDFFKRHTEPLPLPLVREVHRRADVVKEHAHRTPARSDVVVPFPSAGIHTQRNRDIINESLDIAMKTKRRDTAESRLQVTEDLLDALANAGLENSEDRVNRHTVMRLREGLDRRFQPKRKK